MKKVLVMGATGNVGSRVVRGLKDRGVPVRGFVRDRDRAAEKIGADVELVSGDFSDAPSLRRALEGVHAVFLACANGPRQVEYETGAIDAAAASGVRRIVKLSALGAEVGSPLLFWDWHGRVEEHLRSSGVPAVVLRPAFFMTNLLGAAEGVRHEGCLFAPAAGAAISMVDPEDVAAAAAVALSTEGHEGRAHVLTGPEAISYERIAEEISAATGRHVRFVDVPDEAAQQGLIASGMPDFVADQLVTLFGMLRRGAHGLTTDAVRDLTGREPRSISRFLRENAAPFGAGHEEAKPSGARAADEGALSVETGAPRGERP